jgi:hypothetical protein
VNDLGARVGRNRLELLSVKQACFVSTTCGSWVVCFFVLTNPRPPSPNPAPLRRSASSHLFGPVHSPENRYCLDLEDKSIVVYTTHQSPNGAATRKPGAEREVKTERAAHGNVPLDLQSPVRAKLLGQVRLSSLMGDANE